MASLAYVRTAFNALGDGAEPSWARSSEGARSFLLTPRILARIRTNENDWFKFASAQQDRGLCERAAHSAATRLGKDVDFGRNAAATPSASEPAGRIAGTRVL
jgi:hypothetical protein